MHVRRLRLFAPYIHGRRKMDIKPTKSFAEVSHYSVFYHIEHAQLQKGFKQRVTIMPLIQFARLIRHDHAVFPGFYS